MHNLNFSISCLYHLHILLLVVSSLFQELYPWISLSLMLDHAKSSFPAGGLWLFLIGISISSKVKCTNSCFAIHGNAFMTKYLNHKNEIPRSLLSSRKGCYDMQFHL